MKNKIMAAITAAILSVSAFSTPVQTFIGASVTAEAATTVATPKASRASGKYYSTGSLKVTLSCSTENATIYYSLNGGSYKRYTKAIYITKNCTLKFYAKKSGVTSKVVSRTYKLLPKFTITPNSGSYDGKQTVMLSSKVSGLKFYYTLDGSTPTTESALYTAKGITLTEDCTLRILTSKSGWSSRTVTKQYKINGNTIDDDPEIITENDSILENYKTKYRYTRLTDKQKKIYEKLYNCVSQHKYEVDITSLGCNATDVEHAFYAMDYDNPQFFWLDSGYSYTYIADTVYQVRPAYSRTAQEAAAIQPKIDTIAKNITDLALLQDDLFMRVLVIHNAIVNGTDYTTKGGEHIRDIDGVLVNGEALCEGYAKTFAYLCQMIGIESFCTIGSSNGPHMWNMVKLDGDWYHMDTTFDDPVGDTPTCLYTYFCVTDDQISETHITDKLFTVPKATEDDYNYYKAMGITVYSNAEKAYKALIQKAAANYKNGIMRTEIICTDSCIDELYELMLDKDLEIYDDLELYGAAPTNCTRGYNGTTFYLILK